MDRDGSGWALTDSERTTLTAALDALLPAEGSFPWPSATGLIDDFILARVEPGGTPEPQWPGLDADGLRALLARLAGAGEPAAMTAALQAFEHEAPEVFQAFWGLAVFGYYSRPEVIAAIARDHAPDYHGAPLPRGYAHILTPWDADDPLQLPAHPRGGYIRTEEVRRVDFDRLAAVRERGAGR